MTKSQILFSSWYRTIWKSIVQQCTNFIVEVAGVPSCITLNVFISCREHRLVKPPLTLCVWRRLYCSSGVRADLTTPNIVCGKVCFVHCPYSPSAVVVPGLIRPPPTLCLVGGRILPPCLYDPAAVTHLLASQRASPIAIVAQNNCGN